MRKVFLNGLRFAAEQLGQLRAAALRRGAGRPNDQLHRDDKTCAAGRLPPTLSIGVEQERAGAPSRWTVHNA